MKQKRRCVLFDLDGTLVDTIPDIAHAVNTALAQEGVGPLSHAQVMSVVGRGLRNALVGSLHLCGIAASDARVDELYAVLMETYALHPADQSRPYPQVEQMLQQLVQRDIPFGVLSNKADSLVQVIVKQLFPTLSFASVEGMSSDRPRKPDPQGIISFAQLVGAPLESVLYVGDSEVDWQTACALPAVGTAIVTWGFRSRSELEAANVGCLVDTIPQLEEQIWN